MGKIAVDNQLDMDMEVHVTTYDPGAKAFSFIHGGDAFHVVKPKSAQMWPRSYPHAVSVKVGHDQAFFWTEVGAENYVQYGLDDRPQVGTMVTISELSRLCATKSDQMVAQGHL